MAENGRLQNKIIMVTGATSGIGEATAHALAAMGATLIMVARNAEKAAATQTSIAQQTGNQPHILLADLSVQAQIRQLAADFQANFGHLDVLVNNAGIFNLNYEQSADGFEMTWATNHLNYFLLTNLLLDSLKESEAARIVNVSSGAHVGGEIYFDDPNMTENFSSWKAYSQSKLANVMFTYQLARQLEGTGITANALHPGFVRSGFARNNGWLGRLIMPIVGLAAISPEKGAQTMIYLASAEEMAGVSGKYFDKKKAVSSSELSYDTAAQKRLWEMSAEMVGLAGE
jgi:NAD(P)-dependent dehydrogenase (short-subunit alcohol dehydrogenase family)